MTDSCQAIVRNADFDRYLSALFVPERLRGEIFALYAFNHEVAKIAETVSEPMLGRIRLQWWRETIEEIYSGMPRRHDVAIALYNAIEAADLPRELFEDFFDARELDLESEPFANLVEMETYAEATAGGIMRLAARVLGAGDTLDRLAIDIGIAYAFTGILRALPFHAEHGRIMLPKDHLAAAGLFAQEMLSGRAPMIHTVTNQIAGIANTHLRIAHLSSVPRRFLPALLPGALVGPYLKLLTRADFDPFRDPAELSVPRRQLAMLGAMMRGRI